MFWLISLVTLLAVILMPFSGALSDRVGRRVMLTIALCGYIVLAPLTFYAVGLGSFPLACAAVAVSVLPLVMMQSVGYPCDAEIMPSRVRYSGVALGFNFAAILGGATAPYVSAWLVQQTGNPVAPGYYVMAAADRIDYIDDGAGDRGKAAGTMTARESAGYFLYHSIGTFPGKEAALREELRGFAALWSRADDGQWPAALALRQEFIDRWRVVIGALSGTLTRAENVHCRTL